MRSPSDPTFYSVMAFSNISCILCSPVSITQQNYLVYGKASVISTVCRYIYVCCCYVAHRNHFCLYLYSRSAVSQAKFGQGSNHCEMVFESSKLDHAITKQGSLSSLPNLVLLTVGTWQINLSTKVINRVLLFHLMVLQEGLFQIFILDIQVYFIVCGTCT